MRPMNIVRCAALCLSCMMFFSGASFAEKICLTSSLNSKTGKITVTKKTTATRCPSGSTEIFDTASLVASSTMASGETARGVVGGAGLSSILQFVPISLPKSAPVPIQDSDILIANVANLSDLTGNCSSSACASAVQQAKDNELCTGSFDAPTAPSGKLCVYVDVNYAGYDIESQLMAKSSNPNGGSRFGVGLQWRTFGGYNSKIKASWAYTAP